MLRARPLSLCGGGESFAPPHVLPPRHLQLVFFRTSSFGKLAYVSRFLHSNNSHSSPLASSRHGCLLSSFMVKLPEIVSVLRLAPLHAGLETSHHSAAAPDKLTLLITPLDTGVLLLVDGPSQLAPSPGCTHTSCFSRPHSACSSAGAVSEVTRVRTSTARRGGSCTSTCAQC